MIYIEFVQLRTSHIKTPGWWAVTQVGKGGFKRIAISNKIVIKKSPRPLHIIFHKRHGVGLTSSKAYEISSGVRGFIPLDHRESNEPLDQSSRGFLNSLFYLAK